MLTIDVANMLIGALTLFMAYAVSVTLTGAFRAFVAHKMGDDTGAQLGFLTLNPVMHMDPFGVLFLFLFLFGWGRFIPVNPLNIRGPLKIAIASFSDTIAHLFLAFCGVIFLVVGLQWPIDCGISFDQIYLLGFSRFASLFPECSSMLVASAFLIVSFVYLNVILTVLTLILNAFWIIAFHFGQRFREKGFWGHFTLLLIPLMLLMFFSDPLRRMASQFLCIAAHIITRLFGL